MAHWQHRQRGTHPHTLCHHLIPHTLQGLGPCLFGNVAFTKRPTILMSRLLWFPWQRAGEAHSCHLKWSIHHTDGVSLLTRHFFFIPRRYADILFSSELFFALLRSPPHLPVFLLLQKAGLRGAGGRLAARSAAAACRCGAAAASRRTTCARGRSRKGGLATLSLAPVRPPVHR